MSAHLPRGPDPTLVRRRSLLGLGAAGLAVAAGGPLHRSLRPPTGAVPLYSGGVGSTDAGERMLLAPDELFPRGRSRVLDPPAGQGGGGQVGAVGVVAGVAGLRAAEESVLAAAQGVVAPRWADLATDCLLDLNVLSHGLPAPVAAWTPYWRYVWPRDAAHVCRTMAQLGRHEEVLAWLAFLVGVQRPDGHFEARYTLEGGVPDDRPVQADGVGWFLWAVAECCAFLPEHRSQILDLTGAAAGTALRAVYADLDATGGLPSPTPDYWEVRERRTTLGIAAMTLAGLQAAARVGATGRPGASGATGATGSGGVTGSGGEAWCPEAQLAGRYASHLREAVVEGFGPRGYQRYTRGGGHDAAITFLLPPYVTGLEAEVEPLLDRAWESMLRPAGGVAPGAGWKDDGISWTPETALFAQAWAEGGGRAGAGRAAEVLAWLDAHRTPAGSLPEKVLADGSPAAVAPLAWTCAVTASTILRLG